MITRISVLIVIFFIGCCPCSKKKKGHKIEIGGITMLYGEISRGQLFEEYPEWLNFYENYTPNLAQCDTLALIRRKINVEIYLGTWCIDSKREVPGFFRILDQAGFVRDNKVILYAVNREKKTISGMAEKRTIKRVPTFVFYEGNREIGRIVEWPIDTHESDMIQILMQP